MNIYLIRHGQSHENARGLRHRMNRVEFNAFLCDAPNVPLTDLGIRQSRKAAATLSGLSIARLYTSPFARAMTTAMIIGQALNLTPVAQPELCEVLPESLTVSQRVEPVALLYLRGYLCYPSWREVYLRAIRVWDIVSRERVTTIALVSHFAFIQFLILTAHQKWRLPLRSYHLDNGGITQLEIRQNGSSPAVLI